jgi:hypothetical protein
MNTWRYIIIVALALVCPAFQAHAVNREQVVGMWAEIHPKDNVVYFAKDGSWKLYLKKGEIGDLHSLDGKWTLTTDGKIKIVLTLNGQTKEFSSKIKLDGEELVLTEDGGEETRHRRHKGPLPERFQW